MAKSVPTKHDALGDNDGVVYPPTDSAIARSSAKKLVRYLWEDPRDQILNWACEDMARPSFEQK